MEAQFDLRGDLGIVRVAHRRQAAGAEQDGIRFLAKPHGAVGHRFAGREIIVGAGRSIGEAEFEVRCRLDPAQDFQRWRHHFRTDAIAAEHGNVERVVCGHGIP